MSETWYIGDPCYVIPDERWSEFCDVLSKHGYRDVDIVWDGVTMPIRSNGGDGSWSFGSLGSFCVDAGIFTVIPMSLIESYETELEARRLGIIMKSEPTLRVEDGIIYINDEPDDSVGECWQCGHIEQGLDDGWSCENGICTGCDNCFECGCEEE